MATFDEILSEIPQGLLIVIGVLVVIELVLLIVALIDWGKQPKTMQNRNVWLIIIIFVNTIGPILYFLIAPRGEPPVDNFEADTWTMGQDK